MLLSFLNKTKEIMLVSAKMQVALCNIIFNVSGNEKLIGNKNYWIQSFIGIQKKSYRVLSTGESHVGLWLLISRLFKSNGVLKLFMISGKVKASKKYHTVSEKVLNSYQFYWWDWIYTTNFPTVWLLWTLYLVISVNTFSLYHNSQKVFRLHHLAWILELDRGSKQSLKLFSIVLHAF